MADEHTCATWWSICECSILNMMYRAANGEDPDDIYAEVYANSAHARP